MLASEKGHRDCAQLLLGRKADIDQQNKVTRGEGWEVARTVVGADSCIAGMCFYGCDIVVRIFYL